MHGEVTRILGEIKRGEPQAAAALIPLVYDELRKLAAARLARERPGQTLQPTALVHEAYARLLGPDATREAAWNGRGHFFGAAAEAMRRIIDCKSLKQSFARDRLRNPSALGRLLAPNRRARRCQAVTTSELRA